MTNINLISVSANPVCIEPRWELDSNYLGKRPDTTLLHGSCSKINIGGSDPSQNYLYNTLSKCQTNCQNIENCNIISRYGGKSITANWHCWGYSCPDFGNINWIAQTQWGNGKESSNIYKLYCVDSTTIPTTTPTTSPAEITTTPTTSPVAIFNAFPNFNELLSPADGDKINNWITLSEKTRIPPGGSAAYDGYIVPHGTQSYRMISASANGSMEQSGMCCKNSVDALRSNYPSKNLLYLPNFEEPARWSEQVWVPCYQKLVDGKKSEDFHSKCDGKGPTVTVAKLSNGKLIGGYAGVSWASSGGFTNSLTSFLFSLTNDLQYNLKSGEEEYAQFHRSGYGPTFGHGMDLKFIPSGGDADDVGCSMGESYECNGHGSCSNDFCGTSDGFCCYWRVVDNLVVWHHLEITQTPTAVPSQTPTAVPSQTPTAAPSQTPTMTPSIDTPHPLYVPPSPPPPSPSPPTPNPVTAPIPTRLPVVPPTTAPTPVPTIQPTTQPTTTLPTTTRPTTTRPTTNSAHN